MKNLHRRGMVSVYALTMMLLITGMMLAVSDWAVGNMNRRQRDSRALVAFQMAQAGLEQEIALAFAGLPAAHGNFVYTSRQVNEDLEFLAPGASGSTTVVPSGDPRNGWVTCSAAYMGVNRSVRAYIASRDVGIWNNAIFAGSGASGQAINGNVDIRGSVHILGDGEAFLDLNANGLRDAAEAYTDVNGNGVWDVGEPYVDANGDGDWDAAEPYNDSNGNGWYDPPLTQTDLNSSFSGSAYMGNNYSGMDGGLESMVPNPPRPNNIESLGAEIRVKHGRISVSGSASVGTSTVVDGGTSKATVDGSFVSDGYTGSAGSSSVFSDNGPNNGYDVGALGIQFPLLSGIGSEAYVDSGGNTWSDHKAFLDARSLTIPISTVDNSTPAFSYGPDAYGNSITWTPPVVSGNKITSPGVLETHGIVRVSGDLTIGAKQEDLRYRGSGSLYATGFVFMHSNFLPATGEVFPTTTRVGIIAGRNIELATGNGDAQLKMAGAFYAQGKIVSAKQNEIAGTFVAQYFDMGTNVPKIYQVPSLPANMPPGMPGDKSYYTIKVKTWRQRVVSQ